MNIQEMLSKISPQMLSQGLKQISQGLSPEQLQQAEAAIKSSGLAKELANTDINHLQAELKNNPQLLKNLAQNKDLVSKLENIVKKK
jgi:methionyl-tRNA formyltransferase